MICYRLCQRAFVALDGEGARLYGGRWNPKGTRMVYAASSLSLTVLESLVHWSSSILPQNYVSVAIEVPGDIDTETWDVTDLPPNWRDMPSPDALQSLGKNWLAQRKTAVLVVPSAVVPTEQNVLINPVHPNAKRIRAKRPVAFQFDARLRK
jgi:RES domain-containing protein